MNMQPGSKRRQEGALLYTTLGVLLVITLLAASAITVTSIQQRVAVNTQAVSQVFHAAQAAINGAIKDDSALFDAVVSSPEVLVVDLQNTNITSTAEISLSGTGTATGFSLGVESGSFAAYQFEITGTGEITTRPSKAELVQGLYKIVPSG